jgi:hypothetical protein
MRIKEEFYLRRLFDDDVPVFVDATRQARREIPYELSAKRSLKATCAVRTDNEVVAFSLRSYTARQVENEIDSVESVVDGRTDARNLLRPRMPRKTLHELNDSARALAPVLGTDMIAELDGELYVLAPVRTGDTADLRLTARLTRTDDGYIRAEVPEDTDVEFELPVIGVRLRIFLRSPVRDRILAYAFGGYLARKPGETESVVRATALAVNSLTGLATFRMLSGFHHFAVPPRTAAAAVRHRPPEERVLFDLPVLLFTEDEVPAARGPVRAEIDLDHVDPVTGGLRIRLTEGDRLEWNPAVAGTVDFRAYEQVLAETAASMVHAALGEDAVRNIAYDIMLSDVAPEVVARIRASTADLPGLVSKPGRAEVRQGQVIATDGP